MAEVGLAVACQHLRETRSGMDLAAGEIPRSLAMPSRVCSNLEYERNYLACP
jgi:hypothetical protein